MTITMISDIDLINLKTQYGQEILIYKGGIVEMVIEKSQKLPNRSRKH